MGGYTVWKKLDHLVHLYPSWEDPCKIMSCDISPGSGWLAQEEAPSVPGSSLIVGLGPAEDESPDIASPGRKERVKVCRQVKCTLLRCSE